MKKFDNLDDYFAQARNEEPVFNKEQASALIDKFTRENLSITPNKINIKKLFSKKGVVELADLLLINKADKNNSLKAELTQRAYQNALNLLPPATEGWKSEVLKCSAIEGTGIWEVWTTINNFRENVINSGVFYDRRKKQTLQWMEYMIEEGIKQIFYSNSNIKENLDKYRLQVMKGEIMPTQAVNELLVMFNKGL